MFGSKAIQCALTFAKSIISGPDGYGSASRTTAVVPTVAVSICLVLHAAYTRGGIPTPDQLYGMATIIVAASGSYVAKKITDSRANASTDLSVVPSSPGGRE